MPVVGLSSTDIREYPMSQNQTGVMFVLLMILTLGGLATEFVVSARITPGTVCIVSGTRLDQNNRTTATHVRCGRFNLTLHERVNKLVGTEVTLNTPVTCTTHLYFGRFTRNELQSLNHVTDCSKT